MIITFVIAHRGKNAMESLEDTVDILPESSRSFVLEDLYEKAFPAFARFAARMRGSFADARDVFHDALVIYHEKTLREHVSIQASPEAYVVGIAKHLWIRKFNLDRKKVSLDSLENGICIPSDFHASVNEVRLLNLLERTGRKCLELLGKFYFDQAPLKEIAGVLGYRNEHSAAVQKFKCLGKMRQTIKEKNMNYEDFLH